MRRPESIPLLLILMANQGRPQTAPLPQVRVADLSGTSRNLLATSAQAQIVMFWQPDHARARVALCEVASLTAARDTTRLAAVVPGVYSRDEIERAVAGCAEKPAVLVDAGREAFAAYHVVALPTVLVIDSEYRVRLRLASFGSEALGRLRDSLDAIHGHKVTPAILPAQAPAGAVGRLEMARRLLKLGMANKAEEVLISLTKEYPGFRPAWVTLGYKRISEGKPEQAKVFFDKALELDAKGMDVAPGLAWISALGGDREQAARWVSAADQRDPNYPLVERIKK